MNEKELSKLIEDSKRHELKLECAWCKKDTTLWNISETDFHNHKPFNGLIEIWECQECDKLTLAIWKLSELKKLEIK